MHAGSMFLDAGAFWRMDDVLTAGGFLDYGHRINEYFSAYARAEMAFQQDMGLYGSGELGIRLRL